MTNCKTCKKCQKQKRLYQFKAHNTSRDGRVNTCKKCEEVEPEKVLQVSERIREYFARLDVGQGNYF